MKPKYIFALFICSVVICVSFYVSDTVHAVGASELLSEQTPLFSGGFDLRFAALLFFFAFIAFLPTFHMWDDQNGS